VVVGYAPDVAKGLEFDYDVILRFFTEKEGKSGEEVYKAEVLKDRTQTYRKNQIIENPSFENWKSVYTKSSALKENVIDFKKDIVKDEIKMTSELETMESVIKEFKATMKDLTKENQVKVAKLLKEKAIDNPLKTDNLEGMLEVMDFIRAL
jgi:hypothetical protein